MEPMIDMMGRGDVTVSTLFRPGVFYVARVAGWQRDTEALKKLKERDYETFYPQIRRLKPRPRRSMSAAQRAKGLDALIQVSEAVLPRYMILRMSIREPWSELFKICGLSYLLSQKGQPLRIEDREIERMRCRVAVGVIKDSIPIADILMIGERVLVREDIPHTLAGLRGTVERVTLGRIGSVDIMTGLRIRIDMFGGSIPVDIDPAFVERVPATPVAT